MAQYISGSNFTSCLALTWGFSFMADLIVPATKEQMASIKLYADLLGEAKIRIGIINHFITGKAELPGPLIRQSAFLQLRMLCELIALGCFVAHGDITRRTKLRKEWSAYRIIEALENLHQDFYPLPLDQNLQFSPTKDDYLTKEDLISLNH